MKFGSGVRLGNWREDDALEEMRMADHIEAKEGGSLTLLKKKARLGPQLAPVTLTAAPSDGTMKIGDVCLLQSYFNNSTLSVCTSMSLPAADAIDPDAMHPTVGSAPDAPPSARNAVKFVSYEGAAAGTPLCYGQKVCLEFSCAGEVGYLSSQRSGRSQLATQVINKQEAFMRVPKGTTIPYDSCWTIEPVECDERIIKQGTPVIAGSPFVIVHCFTLKRLAAVNVGIVTDFGRELGVCVHTYYDTSKVNKMMRETIGRPTHGLISRNETEENYWGVVYA